MKTTILLSFLMLFSTSAFCSEKGGNTDGKVQLALDYFTMTGTCPSYSEINASLPYVCSILEPEAARRSHTYPVTEFVKYCCESY